MPRESSARLIRLPASLHSCSQTFGIKADLLGLLPGRQTYVIDVNGRCVLSFNDQFKVEQHVDEALKVREQYSVV